MYVLNSLSLGHMPRDMPRILRAGSSRFSRSSSLAARIQI